MVLEVSGSWARNILINGAMFKASCFFDSSMCSPWKIDSGKASQVLL